jgi:predicted AAA+ superfamily ATPase
VADFHPRALLPVLQHRIDRWPIVVLTGARQSGKTTLVRDLLPRHGVREIAYTSLDDPDERLRLAAESVRLLDRPDALVVLDEIQKQPGLLDAVKLLADRKAGHKFLLLGSSQILLLRQIRETLAGRATLLDLWPLALAERVDATVVPPSGLDRIWQDGESALSRLGKAAHKVEDERRWRHVRDDHLMWGGYPGLEPLGPEDRVVWLRDFRRTYLERDLSDLGQVADLDQFALAQNLLAARTGQLLSYSEIARELGVAVNTVKRYVRFLEISYQVVLIRPLLPTTTARLVKSPKLYWTDPGLARVLSERMSTDDGPLFETFVMCEFLRWASWQPDAPQIHFYRTHAGLEIDFVVHSPRLILAIEARAGRRVGPTDARSLAATLPNLRIPGARANAVRLGIVVSRTAQVTELGPKLWSVPDWILFGPAG